jgi:hypothetical protein
MWSDHTKCVYRGDKLKGNFLPRYALLLLLERQSLRSNGFEADGRIMKEHLHVLALLDHGRNYVSDAMGARQTRNR